jgi:hypothetical protein
MSHASICNSRSYRLRAHATDSTSPTNRRSGYPRNGVHYTGNGCRTHWATSAQLVRRNQVWLGTPHSANWRDGTQRWLLTSVGDLLPVGNSRDPPRRRVTGQAVSTVFMIGCDFHPGLQQPSLLETKRAQPGLAPDARQRSGATVQCRSAAPGWYGSGAQRLQLVVRGVVGRAWPQTVVSDPAVALQLWVEVAEAVPSCGGAVP